MYGCYLAHSSSAGPKPTRFGALQSATVIRPAIIEADVVAWVNARLFKPAQHLDLVLARGGDCLEG
jgi:hypothetical protein